MSVLDEVPIERLLEVAQRYGRGPDTVFKAAKRGLIPHAYRRGRGRGRGVEWRYPPVTLACLESLYYYQLQGFRGDALHFIQWFTLGGIVWSPKVANYIASVWERFKETFVYLARKQAQGWGNNDVINDVAWKKLVEVSKKPDVRKDVMSAYEQFTSLIPKLTAQSISGLSVPQFSHHEVFKLGLAAFAPLFNFPPIDVGPTLNKLSPLGKPPENVDALLSQVIETSLHADEIAYERARYAIVSNLDAFREFHRIGFEWLLPLIHKSGNNPNGRLYRHLGPIRQHPDVAVWAMLTSLAMFF